MEKPRTTTDEILNSEPDELSALDQLDRQKQIVEDLVIRAKGEMQRDLDQFISKWKRREALNHPVNLRAGVFWLNHQQK